MTSIAVEKNSDGIDLAVVPHPDGSSHSAIFSNHVSRYLPGLALALLIAGVAIVMGKFALLQANGVSALTLAIVLGMLVGNTIYPRIAVVSGTGVGFTKQHLLRLGIILYGLRLTFQDIAHVGIKGVVIDAVVLSSTFCIAWFVGTKVFKLDQKTAMLIGAGSAICGAAAVMAAQPVIKGRAEQTAVAVSTVVVFGTMAMFLYPALYQLNAQLHWFNVRPAAYGMFTGSTVHEVAQVVAAAHAISNDAANTAVIAKMVRVMMLAPFLLILSAYLSRSQVPASSQAADADQVLTQVPGSQLDKIVIPWFALVFVVVAGVNSLGILPHAVTAAAIDIDTLILAMAMAALGLTTHVSSIRQAGVKPLLLAAVLFCWLVTGGLGINAFVGMF